VIKILSGFAGRRRVLHEKFWLNEHCYICIDILRLNREIFQHCLEQYKGDLILANSLRYAIELVDEIEKAAKAKNVIGTRSAHKRYADHWNNTLRKQVIARHIRLVM
jgi:hypothetical protein